jgi:hypothetical protein
MNPPSTIPNTELGEVRDSYSAMAAWIARDPDGEAFVFRKLDRSATSCTGQCRLIVFYHEIHSLDEKA